MCTSMAFCVTNPNECTDVLTTKLILDVPKFCSSTDAAVLEAFNTWNPSPELLSKDTLCKIYLEMSSVLENENSSSGETPAVEEKKSNFYAIVSPDFCTAAESAADCLESGIYSKTVPNYDTICTPGNTKYAGKSEIIDTYAFCESRAFCESFSPAAVAPPLTPCPDGFVDIEKVCGDTKADYSNFWTAHIKFYDQNTFCMIMTKPENEITNDATMIKKFEKTTLNVDFVPKKVFNAIIQDGFCNSTGDCDNGRPIATKVCEDVDFKYGSWSVIDKTAFCAT